MKIIAIDSSGLVASVAYLEDDILKAEYSVNHKKTHSQTLLPMLDEIVKMAEIELSEIDAIAIAKGPGSFTGLRIGSATVKGLGFALKKPVIEVSTLDALAYNLCGLNTICCPIMDARRDQVYTGIYEFLMDKEEHCFKMVSLSDNEAMSIDDLCAKLNEIGRPVTFTGDGIPVYKEKISSILNVDYSFAPANTAAQKAGCLAMIAKDKFIRGEFVDAAEHSPEYLRLSQAERERMEAGNK